MKKQISLIALMFLGLVLNPIFSKAQAKISVDGEVSKPLNLSMEDLKEMKSHEVTTNMKGEAHTFKGVRLFDVLDAAGVTLGKELRGENLTKSLLLTAADGYQVTYALAEIDPEFTDQVILLAYEVDGQPLPQGEGPFRIVAPDDKRPARWIRELTSIKVLFPKD